MIFSDAVFKITNYLKQNDMFTLMYVIEDTIYIFVVFNKKLGNQYFLCWAVYQLKETNALCIMYSHKHYPTTQNLCWHNSSWIQSFCTGNCIWNCHLIYNLLVWMYCKEKLTKLHTVPKLFHNSRKPKQTEKIIVRTLIMFF